VGVFNIACFFVSSVDALTAQATSDVYSGTDEAARENDVLDVDILGHKTMTTRENDVLKRIVARE